MLLSTGDATLSEGTLVARRRLGRRPCYGPGSEPPRAASCKYDEPNSGSALVRPHDEVHWAKVRHPYRVLEGQQLYEHLRHQHGYPATHQRLRGTRLGERTNGLTTSATPTTGEAVM